MHTQTLSRIEQAEEAVVGILLRKPAMILSCPIEARWFKRHRKVIDAMLKLAARGLEIDVIALSELIEGNGVIGELAEIQSNSFSAPGNYKHYLEMLRDTFQGGIIRSALADAVKEIDEGMPPKEALNRALADSMRVQADSSQNYAYNMKQAMTEFINALETAFDAKDKGGLGLKIGLPKVDKTLGGIHPSDLTIVGARPSVGKTAFGLSVVHAVAKQGKRVGFFSVEMPVIQIMQRIMSLETGVSAAAIRDVELEDTDWTRISNATASYDKLDIRVFDKPSITIGELTMQARSWAMDGGIDFILIDYLTRVKPDKKTDNQNLDVGEVVTGMKNLARTLNIPVMVLAQLNRGSATRADKRPSMADLRDSGIIEQEADQILMLYREAVFNYEADETEAEIIIDKNRHGQCGTVLARFDPLTMRWGERFDD